MRYTAMNKFSLFRLPELAKLILFCIVLNCNPNCLSAQSATFIAENKIDVQGKKDGNWRKLDSLGKVQYEGQFRHGVPYGEFRYYYDTGKTRTISQITDDGSSSKTINFHPNGMKMAEGNYVRKLKEGEWTYYDEQGVMISKETYVAGKKNGLASTYYNDGKLLEEKHFEAGVEVGPWKQFFTDGVIKTTAVYIAGKIEGQATFYYPDGKVLARGNYIHGLKDGVWVFMSEEGKKQKEDKYKTGQLISTVNYDPKLDEDLKK